MKNKELKKLAYELRQDTVDIIMAGGGGHIGGDMSIMEILVELYFDQMNIRKTRTTRIGISLSLAKDIRWKPITVFWQKRDFSLYRR